MLAQTYAYVRMSDSHRASHAQSISRPNAKWFFGWNRVGCPMCRQIDNWAATKKVSTCMHRDTSASPMPAFKWTVKTLWLNNNNSDLYGWRFEGGNMLRWIIWWCYCAIFKSMAANRNLIEVTTWRLLHGTPSDSMSSFIVIWKWMKSLHCSICGQHFLQFQLWCSGCEASPEGQ